MGSEYDNNVVDDKEKEAVVLGLDGGTTSTICVCIPLRLTVSDDDVPPVLGRAVAGCSNHNSVGVMSLSCLICE
ncbi:N-acetyl-D-glucosamine kinase [Artemisia annua]|uniref:N-acetyl-D-glucosamine kinase n=1 Tax=Artemisia annua TaxID=35608 RepID=A0A2U1NJ75_ARTAN|nr:N-acetyl-D-glucosamine kinase [Artemisia annua]